MAKSQTTRVATTKSIEENSYVPSVLNKRPRGAVNSISVDAPVSSLAIDANAKKEVTMSYDASAFQKKVSSSNYVT